jgi:RNA polymerase sigma factor (TIGR02999 family)
LLESGPLGPRGSLEQRKVESPQDITHLLSAWEQGDKRALERLTEIVEGQLRAMARGYLQKGTRLELLQATDLVNETYLRLVNQQKVHWKNRKHFFAIAATCMRRALLDYIKAEQRKKRGGGAEHVSLSEAAAVSNERGTELIALDDALHELEKQDPRKSQVIEMRYFGGYRVEDVADVLGVSIETVERDSRLARAWLKRELLNDSK